jgi:DNA helicase-2/ATP-dependent DNA helicase PcrA
MPRPQEIRAERNAAFDAAFQKLNPAQKAAVETTEGPVMVIAGPGTGKTQTVSMRVAHILRKTQMRPGNILCLTFSVSGATAMRDRLRSLIGPDAYGVVVKNFHAFCNDIISDNPSLFDEWSATNQITDLERYRQVNAILDAMLPDLAIVNPKSPYNRTREILDRISQVKREGKTHADLVRVADEYADQMESKSKPGTKAHEKNVLAARKFREFAEIFARYDAMLKNGSRYDFDDMILYVIQALEKDEGLLLMLQERYQYILVDEFQDTNGSQYRLIELLTTYPYLDQAPNLFVVGDDDQAIYRFQGANLQNILRFRDRFPQSTVITLTTSYRSTQNILDAAGRLIMHNTERLVGRIDGLTKDLTSASGLPGEDPVLLRPPSDMAEPWMIADLIEERLSAGILPTEIAVITQKNQELREYFDVLSARGIPVRMSGKADLLTHPLVLQAIAILRGLAKPHDDALLADALGASCCGCHPADLGRLFRAAREQKRKLIDILLSLDQPATLLPDVQWKSLDCILKHRDLLLDMHHKIKTRTVMETLERVLHDCGLIPKGGEIHPLDLAALQVFFNKIGDRMIEEPAFSFEDFLRDLEFYMDPDYGQLRITYELPHLVSEGVQLITAHQSKGQEFETVFLVNFREGQWDKKSSPGGLSVPEDLLYGWEKEQKTFEKNQDERRVAYVAMTRARKELLLSCPREATAGDKSREVAPSAFFAEAGPLPERDVELQNPEQASTLLLKTVTDFDAEYHAFLDERIQGYALSASAINRFLEDPTEFLRVDLLQVPQLAETVLAYGNAVHWALKQWGMRMQRGAPMSREEFLGEFRNFLIQREFLSGPELERLLHVGQAELPRYYDARLAGSIPYIASVETSYTARLGDIPIKGKIDRIDRRNPDSALGTVIDYKTGRPKSENDIRGGDIYRQLQFYAVLLELALPSLTPEAFLVDFVGDREEHPVLRTFQMGDEDKKQMRDLIGKVWAKILAHDFTPLQL